MFNNKCSLSRTLTQSGDCTSCLTSMDWSCFWRLHHEGLDVTKFATMKDIEEWSTLNPISLSEDTENNYVHEWRSNNNGVHPFWRTLFLVLTEWSHQGMAHTLCQLDWALWIKQDYSFNCALGKQLMTMNQYGILDCIQWEPLHFSRSRCFVSLWSSPSSGDEHVNCSLITE